MLCFWCWTHTMISRYIRVEFLFDRTTITIFIISLFFMSSMQIYILYFQEIGIWNWNNMIYTVMTHPYRCPCRPARLDTQNISYNDNDARFIYIYIYISCCSPFVFRLCYFSTHIIVLFATDEWVHSTLRCWITLNPAKNHTILYCAEPLNEMTRRNCDD